MANGNLDLRLCIRADSKELVGALSRAQSGLRGLARVGATVSRALGRAAAWARAGMGGCVGTRRRADACRGRSLVRRGGRGRFEAGGGA